MNITELDKFNLQDAVKFHDRLNPRLWGPDEHLLPVVAQKLLAIAADFQEFLGVNDLDIEDITISGSNAAYSYTPSSDIDLHLVVRMPTDNSDVYQELFTAKKYQYNDEHDIRIGGADVELYVQPADQAHHSQGIYSVKDGEWRQVPKRGKVDIDDHCVEHKTQDLQARIKTAIASGDESIMQRLWDKIKTMRQTGLESSGEFGCDNLVFKMLRRSGHIEQLRQARTAAHDRALGLQERKRKKRKTRYGFGGYWYPGFAFGSDAAAGGDAGGESMREGHQGQPYSSEDGVAASTQMFLNETDSEEQMLQQFIQDTAEQLGIERMPKIVLHRDDDWGVDNHSFGRYDAESHTLHVNLAGRHVMDVLRTTAHELAHCRQHELSPLPHNAGDTGSPWENQAHATAGIIMRQWADRHPEMFDSNTIEESASGYIPKNSREAQKPQYAMALSVDIKPGEVGRQANKLALHTGRNGEPQLLMKTANLREGRIRDLNEPLGPETPPTMPAGTVRVDVSDVYDWYKLGNHISNLKGLGRHDFGSGPPSTIVSFGDEDTEHKFINDLEATGLDVTDIDPRDPNQPRGMKKIKTDPTYNVDESATQTAAQQRVNQALQRGLAKQDQLDRQRFDREWQTIQADPNLRTAQDKFNRSWVQGPRRPGGKGAEEALAAIKEITPDGTVILDSDPSFQHQAWFRNVLAQGGLPGARVEYFKPMAQPRVTEDDIVESLRREFALLEDEFLPEIRMSPSSLRAEAAQTGAQAGMEFEMIVPDAVADDDGDELEPDYDQDERAGNFDDIENFFFDGDFNGRRDVQRLMSELQSDYLDWFDEAVDEKWQEESLEYITSWLWGRYRREYKEEAEEMVDAEYGDKLSADERAHMITSVMDDLHTRAVAGVIEAGSDNDEYNSAKDDWMSDNVDQQEMQNQWLRSEGMYYMSDVWNSYSGFISWPYWTSSSGGDGDPDVDSIANDFSEAIGRPVNASRSYHGARREAGHYVVEPDGSLRADNDNDAGLEFVSPPLPIDELLSDLNKVKAWADKRGCYTNSSTGLHINISVPGFDNAKLDYVKLALLLGDEYVLEQFGRSSNTYAQSALGKVKNKIKQNPEGAKVLLDKMRAHMEDLATKSIHSGKTDKYTSINTKEGYIEFRSPGGDWLDENFDKIENTLMRFTVALNAAMDPEAYRQEYLKKLYKLLEPAKESQGSDTVQYFADYVAGRLPRSALTSFVRTAQLQRKVQKGQVSNEKMWWRVGLKSNPNYSIEVVGRSRDEAVDAAMEANPDLMRFNFENDFTAYPVRLTGEHKYEVFRLSDRRVIATLDADDDQHALEQFDIMFPGADRQRYDVRRAGTAEPQGPIRYEIYDLTTGRVIQQISANNDDEAIDYFYRITPDEDRQHVEVRRARNQSEPTLIAPETQPDANFAFVDRTNNQVVQWLTRNTREEAERELQGTGLAHLYNVVEVRPRNSTDNRPMQPSGVSDSEATHEIVDRRSLRRMFVFSAQSETEAADKFEEWLLANGYPVDNEYFGWRRISRPIPGSTLDLQRQRAAAQPEASSDQWWDQPTGTSGFTGTWRVMIDGEEVHRFSGVGNVQADALRIGQRWVLNQIRQGQLNPVPGAEVEVVPEMR